MATLEIAENKLISISYGVLGVVLAALIGGILWLSSVASTAKAAHKISLKNNDTNIVIINMVSEVKSDIAEIKGYLKAKGESINGQEN